MQEIDIQQIESEYMSKWSSYYIEDMILSSFWKEGLKRFIKDVEKDYFNSYVSYQKSLTQELKKWDENEMIQFIIERIHFYFVGWEEVERYYEFLKRLENYYKRNHIPRPKNSDWVDIDIKSIPITEIIWMYIKLDGNINRNIHCPLHKDNSPSFKIYKNTNSFYCFWCHKWWNAVNFIAEIENTSTTEAFKKLINLYK